MFNKHKVLAAFLFTFSILLSASSAVAQQWEVKLQVQHRAQKEDWSCGPNTIAMWAGYIRRASYDTMQIADRYTGRDGTSLPEFRETMDLLAPRDYEFSEWGYTNKYTAIKGIMYTIAQYKEPVAIAGNNGGHYYLVVGGVATKNPYYNYGKDSKIKYLYLHDSRENSPLYTNARLISSQWKTSLSILNWPIFKKGQRYTPNEVMHNWTLIPWWRLGNRQWISVERGPYEVWKSVITFSSY